VQTVAAEAADYGIEYGLEVVNRYETNILNTAQQVCTISLLEGVRSPC
jgi:sugar phosphate isomerase/epimerase